MELRHLRYFVAVAEELSFTRAAERLHMAQPPLSTQIRQLERELGAELFDRSRRSIRLTEAGRALVDEARHILDELEQAARRVRRIGDGEVGHLTIAFVPSASNSTLPPLLRAFRSRHPEVELFLRELAPDDLLRALHEHRADVAFLYLPFDDDGLDQWVVSTERLLLALSTEHPLAGRAAVDMSDLAEEPFILPGRYGPPGLHARVLEACAGAGFQPRAVQKDVWLMHTIIGLVAADLGIALVPASEMNVHRTGVVYVPLHADAPTVQLGAAWRRDDRSPVLARFLDIVENADAPAASVTGAELPTSRRQERDDARASAVSRSAGH